MVKYCTTCKEMKYENEFAKRSASNDGLQSYCKDCNREYRKENKELIKEYQMAYHKENKEHIKEYGKENRKLLTEYHNEWKKKRYHSDPNFRMKECLSSRLSIFKHSETLEKYRDCADDYFNKWLEYQFTDGMSFDNYGSVWEIDHVLPVSFFNHENEEEYICVGIGRI